MIIVASKEGQLCNRLFHFAHLLSFAIEKDQSIWHPFFTEYKSYFPNLKSNSLKKYKINLTNPLLSQSALEKLTPLISLLGKLPFINLIKASTSEIILSELDALNENNINFLSGWLLRDYPSFSKHADTIRFLFGFSDSNISYAQSILHKIKNEPNSKLIGLHIRRGDYRYWESGKYFFSDQQYKIILDGVTKMLAADNINAKFIFCTNEALDSNSPLRKFSPFISNASEIEDLCLLSQCDYIIGPPSSFSSWASFMGKVPLLHIHSELQSLTNELFSINLG